MEHESRSAIRKGLWANRGLGAGFEGWQGMGRGLIAKWLCDVIDVMLSVYLEMK